MKDPKGLDIAKQLIANCDAVVENFRPGQLDRWGLGAEVIADINPGCVLVHVSGNGQTGPDRDRSAFGVIGEAIGGLRHLTGFPEGTTQLPPARTGVSLGDMVAGLYAAIGLLSAVYARQAHADAMARSVDVALTESVFSLLEVCLPEYLSTFKSDYPDVRVALSEQTSERAVQDVAKGLADIAIFSEAINPLELEIFPYRQEWLVVISQRDHPLPGKKAIHFNDTLDFQHVGLQPGSSLLGQLNSEAAELGRSVSFAVQVTSFDGVRRMVDSGLGIAILPDGAVLPVAREGRLKITPLSDTWARRTLYVGVREAGALTLAARNMLIRLIEKPLQTGIGNKTS